MKTNQEIEKEYMKEFNYIEIYKPEQDRVNWWLDKIANIRQEDKLELIKEIEKLPTYGQEYSDNLIDAFIVKEEVIQIIKN